MGSSLRSLWGISTPYIFGATFQNLAIYYKLKRHKEGIYLYISNCCTFYLVSKNSKSDATALFFMLQLLSLHFFSLCCLFITVLLDANHKISTNLPLASTISLALKMAASAHCGCQTVCLMADSSATATVSSQREAASIFPIVPNEISITYMQVYQYFH